MVPSPPLAPLFRRTALKHASAPVLSQKRAFAPSPMLLIAALACAALPAPLRPQSSAPAQGSEQIAPATLPEVPMPIASSNPFAGRYAPASAFDPASSAFGQNRAPISLRDVNIDFQQRRPTAMNPFQPGMSSFQPRPGFGSSAGSTANGFPGAIAFAPGRQGDLSSPLHPTGSPIYTAIGPFGYAPAALPSLNQLMRGSLSLPFSSPYPGTPSGSLRFTYRDTLRPGAAFGDLNHPNTSAMFTTSDLGNGVFFSAGTGYGIRSTAGAPAASLGNEGGPKHSGTAVNLKLSF